MGEEKLSTVRKAGTRLEEKGGSQLGSMLRFIPLSRADDGGGDARVVWQNHASYSISGIETIKRQEVTKSRSK